MWAVFAAALIAAFRKRLGIRLQTWRRGHAGLVVVTVTGSVLHAMLIEGTMETMSKFALCVLVALALIKAVADLRSF